MAFEKLRIVERNQIKNQPLLRERVKLILRTAGYTLDWFHSSLRSFRSCSFMPR